jgi:hypothetical protein
MSVGRSADIKAMKSHENLARSFSSRKGATVIGLVILTQSMPTKAVEYREIVLLKLVQSFSLPQ